ncbi:hypothetical protein [Subtercola vilae]|uniref:DUF11 domain-containing protein n=1 Tax=Subtercola vilae TaxID=2056433 RepID=A0A4T2BTG3_9MICO|nr:hypothetical protein [Subtercola vilae]TIH34292.1 hypothetical protein D4765_13345 [Subtercola vilae]
MPVVSWIVVGVVLVAAGVGVWFALRKHKRGASALGLVLLLAGGGALISTAGAPPAQAAAHSASCAERPVTGAVSTSTTGSGGGTGSGAGTNTGTPTPSGGATATPTPTPTVTSTPTEPPLPLIDLTPTAEVEPSILPNDTPTAVNYIVTVKNVLSDPSTGTTAVFVDRPSESLKGAVTYAGAGWTLDTTSPTFLYFIYATPIAGGASSQPLTVQFQQITLAGAPVTIGTTIPTGSGGDTNPTNNSASAVIRLFV